MDAAFCFYLSILFKSFSYFFDMQDPECKGIITTLPGHTNRVNCVEFINRGI